MLKKNNLFLCCLCFSFIVFTGCTVNYNIDIDDKIKEEIYINETDNTKYESDIYGGRFYPGISYKEQIETMNNIPQFALTSDIPEIYDATQKVAGVTYFDTEIISNSNSYGIKMSSEIKRSNMETLRSVKYCYDQFMASSKSGKFVIVTSGKNNCFETYPYLDQVNVKVTSKYKVVKSNAMKIEKNTYIWNIDRNNYNNQSIYLELDLSSDLNKINNTSIYIILAIIIVSILVIGGIIYLFVRHLTKKNNKI